MDRRIILALVAAVAVLSAGIGWVAGQRIKSPAEIAADKAPPPPSLITVPVELRTLSQDVVVRGTITPSDETELVVASSDGAALITNAPKAAGDLIEEGDVIVEVAGRPVIALQGDLPVFRNLIPTLEGPDVRQLEQALVRLGYDPGDVDEVYTPTTGAAVEQLYRDRGYSAPPSSEGDQAGFEGAKDQVDSQEQTLADARQALADAQEPITATVRQQLDLAVAQSEAGVESAKISAAEAKAEAAAAVTDAEAIATEAAKEAASAASRLQQARDGTHPDTGQPPTPDELTDLEAADAAARTADAAAKTAVTNAKARQTQTATDQDLAIRAAEVAVLEARDARTERLNPPDLDDLRSAVADAQEALTDAEGDLTDATARVGAWIPTAELVFLSTVPRQVATLFAEVGETPAGAVMTISGAETIIESGISTADRRLVEIGDEALLEDDDLGISIKAVVTFVADNPGGGGLSDDRYAMRLEPLDEVPEDAINVNLRIAIPITSSGGDVLAVPLAALSAGADGTARVEIEGASGETTLVEVTTGLRAEGFVQIESLEQPLEEGDRVVVGRDLQLPGSSDADAEADAGSDDDADEDDG